MTYRTKRAEDLLVFSLSIVIAYDQIFYQWLKNIFRIIIIFVIDKIFGLNKKIYKFYIF
jgi:hypothetical protein